MKVIIIGATKAAAAAAARLRRLDESAEIIVIDHRRTVPMSGFWRLKSLYNIDLRLNTRATWSDEAQNALELEDSLSEEMYTESFDKVILAYETGPESLPPVRRYAAGTFDLSGPAVFDMQWAEISGFIAARAPQTALVRGDCLTAFLAAARLLGMGIATTLVPPPAPANSDLDKDVTAYIIAHLAGRGLQVLKDADAPLTAGIGINCNRFKPALPEFVPPVDGAAENQEYPLDTIAKNFFSGERMDVPRLAQKCGRAVAAAVCGGKKPDEALPETSINLRSMEILGNRLTFFGLSEQELNERGTAYIFSALPVAGGFMKLIYNHKGRILGFAAFGSRAAAAADVLAVLVQMNGNIHDLAAMELAAATDLQTLGKIAQNVVEGRLEMAYWDEIAHLDRDKTILLDVRSEGRFAAGSIPNSINIPLADLRIRQYPLDFSKEIITICENGKDSYLAARILAGKVPKIRHLTGGMEYFGYVAD